MKAFGDVDRREAKELMDGMIDFNIHIAEHKPGEIRGQMQKAM